MQQCIVAFKILAAGYLGGVCFLCLERFMPTKMMTWFCNMEEYSVRKRANKDESEKVNNAENKEHHDGEKAVKKLTERAKAQVIASSKKENEECQKSLREGNKRKRIDEENKDKANLYVLFK